MSDAPQAIPPSASPPSSVIHVTRPIEPGCIVVLDYPELLDSSQVDGFIEEVRDDLVNMAGHAEFFIFVAMPGNRVEVFPEGCLDDALDRALDRREQQRLAQRSSLDDTLDRIRTAKEVQARTIADPRVTDVGVAPVGPSNPHSSLGLVGEMPPRREIGDEYSPPSGEHAGHTIKILAVRDVDGTRLALALCSCGVDWEFPNGVAG